MKEFEIVLDVKDKSFDLKNVFECGQCFRWDREEDGSYIGVIKDTVLRVREDKERINCTGVSLNDSIEEYLKEYFDLNTDYKEIKNRLSKIDNYMEKSINYGYGIRILNQDLWETIISFIISANNNIPRIKKIIKAISKAYGKKLVFEGNEYYMFPTAEELKDVTVQDFRNLGLGFRDKRLFKTTHMVLDNEVDLDDLMKMNNTLKIKEELLKLDGVGEKVADCIMLFSLKRRDAFPIDVWVRRVMNELYIHNEDEEKVSKKELQKLAKDKFGDLAGIAQQYLFYWRREQ